jgi:hypothetical protein
MEIIMAYLQHHHRMVSWAPGDPLMGEPSGPARRRLNSVRRIGPVIRVLRRVTAPLFRQARVTLDG